MWCLPGWKVRKSNYLNNYKYDLLIAGYSISELNNCSKRLFPSQ